MKKLTQQCGAHNNSCSRRGVLGFTLIEVMIVVAIVGIIAAIAYPSYAQYVQKSARAEARAALLDLANRQEQYFVDNRVYSNNVRDLGLASNTESGFYSLSIRVSAATFTATASAAGGPALKDVCTSLSIDENGAKTASGGSTEECWGV